MYRGRKTTMTENPRFNFKAVIKSILVTRQRQLPTNPLSCGNQSAYISLVNRRLFVFLPLKYPMTYG